MLTVDQIKIALAINESNLKEVMRVGMLQDVALLKTQRDELKNLLIEAYEAQLAKAA